MKLARCLFVLTSCFALAVPTFSASAVSITNGLYHLHSHPDGGARPPAYGLRLDGLFDGNQNVTITFDFDGPDAAMFMDVDVTPGDPGASTIRIYGKAWGGVDGGGAYVSPKLYDIDFTYVDVKMIAGDDDLWSKTFDSTGTIKESGQDAVVYNLVAVSGSHAYSFRLGDRDNDNGHRGFDGISGWGWINHVIAPTDPASVPHLYYSDWLFVADPVIMPTPTAAGAGLVGLACLGLRMRRRRGGE